MKTLIAIIAMLALASCSAYQVKHEETYGVDGSLASSQTGIFKMVPPGGKDLSEGTLSLGVNDEGGWTMDLGERGQTDLGGTGALIQALILQSQQSGQMQLENQALMQRLQQIQAQVQQIQQRQQQQINAPPEEGE